MQIPLHFVKMDFIAISCMQNFCNAEIKLKRISEHINFGKFVKKGGNVK